MQWDLILMIQGDVSKLLYIFVIIRWSEDHHHGRKM